MSKDYFKGWYFKCRNADKTVAFIPAFHRSGNHGSASLQIITNEEAFNIFFDSLQYIEKPLFIRLENCLFSEKGLKLSICSKKVNICGKLKFSGISPISYDIMGPFKFVPFMQCRHSVYSMKHRIDGHLKINGTQYDFVNGTGYIEGDCGYSFPNRYIWTQCSFGNGSLMLSVAEIPMLKFRFMGIIGIVMIKGREYRIATYLGAKVKCIDDNAVTVKQADFQLTARLIEKNAHPLLAPDNGRMSRTIHESASCKAYYCFSYKGKNIFEFYSDTASFEFEYKK